MKIPPAPTPVDMIDELSVLNDVATSIDLTKRLPAYVFNEPYDVRVLDFGALWSRRFYTSLAALNGRCGASGFAVAVLEPEPRYFYTHFGHYPVLRFTAADGPGEYIDAVNRDPGGSPADAIVHNSTIVVMKADNSRWIVYGDRDAEIALVGGRDAGAVAAIDDCVSNGYTIRQAVSSGVARLHSVAAEELVRNYEGVAAMPKGAEGGGEETGEKRRV